MYCLIFQSFWVESGFKWIQLTGETARSLFERCLQSWIEHEAGHWEKTHAFIQIKFNWDCYAWPIGYYDTWDIVEKLAGKLVKDAIELLFALYFLFTYFLLFVT